MNGLIPTHSNENGNLLVSGRDLHEFLEVKEKYTEWFKRMVDYGFVENIDFVLVSEKRETKNPRNPFTTITNHHIKIPMAKEIAMLQRNEKGKQARLYFLELEEKWNSPEMVMKRAMDYLNAQVEKLQTSNLLLEQQVNELKPKATYYDMVLQNKSLLSVSKIAKDYGMSAIKLNKLLHELGVQYKQGDIWLLYAKHQDKGYTQTHTHVIDADNSRVQTKWTQKGRLFIYELLKQQGILPIIEREECAS
ncbi:antirepressor [Bacillus glycinifermentans]|uniref:Phage antirepressor Ant n=2 Tax=Bacillus TaxID=1386 RepID=A0AAJ3Z3Y7_9BACI|nr:MULTISPECIES: phage antirepressor KilAC domain-containing protein [Bacillus]ATH94509.1 phage antirepressor Ant [Bacillus glycinifermentans]AVB10271.1 phage antirepressor Ant [Bacillus velezensis]KMM52220.1 antirepressor [Bacillus glycinifermentans]MBU8788857.1 phage antirepressor KilAC domain-containing protein [Bacillus glycinifermentans]MEC0496497.1 phage antirepressor KilAC domain-containing protein [Bacillus glycinifermentans]